MSVVYFEAGHPELAFPALEEALRADLSQAIRILGDPAAEAMRADPRYAALIKKLGLK